MQPTQPRALSGGAVSSLQDKNENRADVKGWSQAHLPPPQLLSVPAPSLKTKLIGFSTGKAENATP